MSKLSVIILLFLFINMVFFSLFVARQKIALSAGSNFRLASVNKSSLCTENWTCTVWSACSPTLEHVEYVHEGIQKRNCTDLNNCGTIKNKPVETQTCIYIPSAMPLSRLISLFISLPTLILFLIIIITVWTLKKTRKHKVN